MPTYEFRCSNYTECPSEWEEYLSMSSPIPPCPICGKPGYRLISGGSGKGIVNLTGQDLVNKVKRDAANLERHASKSEEFASNFIGPDTYQKKQVQLDNAKKNGNFRRKDW